MNLVRSNLLLLACIVALLPGAVESQENPDPKVVEAARKEGEIVWYTTMSLDQSKQFMDRFLRKYPFLKPSVFRTGGGALLNRVLSETKAGKNFFDVVNGNGELVLPLMELGVLAPYVSPERKVIPEDLKDDKNFWTSVYVNSIVLGYNKNLVKRENLPRTYDDLLDPRWKGRKISLDDSYTTLLQGLISAWGKEKALGYFKKLAEQEPVIMRGSTVRVQLAAAGEISVGDCLCEYHSVSRRKGRSSGLGSAGARDNFSEYRHAWCQGKPSERGEAASGLYVIQGRPGKALGLSTDSRAQRC
jgi:iron(III) transport system substrate-binding protein